MAHHSKIRQLCAATLGALTLASLLAGVLWSAQDPVEELRQALIIRAEDRSRQSKEFLAYRNKILEERVKALRTISDLRRALIEWKLDYEQGELKTPLQALDEKWRSEVGKRLTDLLREAAHSRRENTRLAVANLIAEMGPNVPALDATDRHGFARSLAPIVVELVHDPHLAVRQEALRALSTINPDPDKASAVFGEVLKEKDSVPLRRMAADGMKRLVRVATTLNKKQLTKSAAVEASTPELIATCADVTGQIVAATRAGGAARDPDGLVRSLSVEAIQDASGAFGDLPSPFKREEFPSPGQVLSEDDRNYIAAQYTRVRGEIGELQPLLEVMAGVGELLRDALTDSSPRARLAAASTLEELSHTRLRLRQRIDSLYPLPTQKKPQIPADFERMVVKNWWIVTPVVENFARDLEARRQAVEFLENLGDDAVPAIPLLTESLADPDRFIRWAAARTLGNLPVEQAAPAVPPIARLLDDNDLDVRLTAAKALERLGPLATAAVQALENKVLDKRSDPEFRVSVMYALLSIRPENTLSAIPLYTQALADPDARVRRTAAEVLGRYGKAAAPAVPALRNALGDEDPEVRTRASDALLNILFQPKNSK
jgi:HEAT repeat protein